MDENIAFILIRDHLMQNMTIQERCGFEIESRSTYRYDFFLKNGCKALDLPPRTAVEIKRRLVSDTISKFHSSYDKDSLSELIIVIIDEGDAEWIKLNSTATTIKGRNIKVFTPEGFLEYKKDITYVEELKNNYLKNNFKQKDEKNQEKELITSVKKAIHENSYTLFLGAGVSCSAGMPGWSELLKAIFRNAIKQAKLEVRVRDYIAINKHPYCSYSPLITAQYICSHLQNDILYSLVKKEIYRKEPSDFTLIDALVNLAKANKPESVITYNFDDLFERRAIEKNLAVCSIVDDNRVEHEELPVYHIHGMLSQNAPITKEERIILDERSYHEESKDSFLWSNIEQLHALRRSVCLFVGLSMTDPNLRRLLDISNKKFGDEPAYHYAFLKREKLKENDEKKNREHQSTIEKMLREFGVTVIWYNKHNELPFLIDMLR